MVGGRGSIHRVLSAAVALILVVFLPGVARAADRSDVFTDIHVVQSDTTVNSRMEISIAFTVPPDVRAGDTATIVVPDTMKWVAASFDILDPATGAVVATVVVSGGTAVFTFTDYVDSQEVVTGTAALETVWDKEKVKRATSSTSTSVASPTR